MIIMTDEAKWIAAYIHSCVCMFANRKITGVVTTLFAKLKRKTFHSALYLGPIQPNLKHNLIFKE